MGVQKCCGEESCTEGYLAPRYDRRCQLINEIKELIGNFDHEEKAKPQQSRTDRGVPGMRDMEDECHQWRKRRDCDPPLITAIALHETRPTSDYTNMRHENSSQVTYIDATKEGQDWRKVPPAPWDLPRTPSQELRAGTLYSDCQCLKRNGLQHDCPRWECAGRPECVAVNPGPCCIPSQWPKPIRGDRRYGQQEKSVAGTPGYGGKQLKTAPLNPEICIPIGGSLQGTLGEKAAGGSRTPQREGLQQKFPQCITFQDVQGYIPSNKSDQVTQTVHGRNNMNDCVMILELDEVVPGVRSKQPPPTSQNQGITLTGPGMTCSCRPIKM